MAPCDESKLGWCNHSICSEEDICVWRINGDPDRITRWEKINKKKFNINDYR
jgi:hypothetical protein